MGRSNAGFVEGEIRAEGYVLKVKGFFVGAVLVVLESLGTRRIELSTSKQVSAFE